MLRFVEPLSGEICHLFFQGSPTPAVFTIFLELQIWAGDGCTHTQREAILPTGANSLFRCTFSSVQGIQFTEVHLGWWVRLKDWLHFLSLKPSMDLPTAGFRIWAFNY